MIPTPSSSEEWVVASLAPWGLGAQLLGVSAALTTLVLTGWALRVERRAERRFVLLALRAGALLSALVLFFQPALRRQSVTRVPNHVALLVDNSESMRLSDSAGGESRAARAAAWIARQSAALEALAREHPLDVYTFGDGVESSSLPAVTRPLGADRPTTDLAGALAAVRARYDGQDLGAILLLSDGTDTARWARAAADPRTPLGPDERELVASVHAPISTGWVGREGLRDLSVARVLADDFAFVRTAVKVEARLHIVGADALAGSELPVTLRRDGEVVRTTRITLVRGETDYPVSFFFTPDRVGKAVYDISAAPLDGEPIVENNRRTFLLRVIRDKVRVLLVAGRPSWDERFLRDLVKHDPNVDLISFFILRTPEDVEAVSSDQLSLIPFPTEELFLEQLHSFDVIFLVNFNFGPYGIGSYLEQLRKYVDDGGGLAMLGGDLSFSLGGWAETPLGQQLPVELPPAGPFERLVALEPFRLELTPEGRAHPLTALAVDVDENRARWAALPPLGGTNLVTRARPGATVLGVHPSLRDADGRPLPVLSVTEAGKGRTLALTSDSSWRWGFSSAPGSRPDPRLYQTFWESSIRWLIHDPSLSFLRVESRSVEWARGAQPRLTVRTLGPDYRPRGGVDVQLSVRAVGRPAETRQLTGRSDDNGEWNVTLEPLAPGGYHASATATLSGRQTTDDEVFIVRDAGRELEEPEARPGLLAALASATGGRALGEGERFDGLPIGPPRVLRSNSHRDLPLWSGWWTLVFGALCLGLEWLLRRRWGRV
jgi:uncharacterized membrane protein